MNRQKFLLVYLSIFTLIGFLFFFGLRTHKNKNFSPEKLSYLTDTVSKFRDKTDDLCKYKILGDPQVGDQYVKINFWCTDSRSSRSTLALIAIPNPTIDGIFSEYSRIINFDKDLISQQKWVCFYNDKEISNKDIFEKILPTSTINCYQDKNLRGYVEK
jgi:hypothetical protein